MARVAEGLVERAFEIANEGECCNASEIAVRLKAEGFSGGSIERHMDGLTLRTQLTSLCRQVKDREANVE